MNPINTSQIKPIKIYFNKSINYQEQQFIADQITSNDDITKNFVVNADLKETSHELQELNTMELKVLARSDKDTVNQNTFNKAVLKACQITANSRKKEGIILNTDQYDNLLFTQS